MEDLVKSGEVDYAAELQKVKAELRTHVIAKMVDAIGPNRAIWRQRLVLRRADHGKYAPDEDVVAYSAIHKLKNPSGDSKQKIMVSDNEIEAYKALDPEFNKALTLTEILEKVTELKGQGKISSAGDNVDDGGGAMSTDEQTVAL